jgi:hypothetical protein
MPDAAPAARGVYKPRRPQASPLLRLVSDHLHRLQTVYDERFAREYGSWRPVLAQVADTFLACGVLEHGFARIRCDACAHAYLLGFSCKGRYFCPSCHAKRLAIWTRWLDTTLLAPVPHRQVVLTIPKRLRAYCLYRRRLLGEIARVAARIVTAAIRTLTGERDLAVGIVTCLQTHGARANWHPHLHLTARRIGPRRQRSPTVTAGPTALNAHEGVGGHAASRQSVLPRPVIASCPRRIVDPPRLKFLSLRYSRASSATTRRSREARSITRCDSPAPPRERRTCTPRVTGQACRRARATHRWGCAYA